MLGMRGVVEDSNYVTMQSSMVGGGERRVSFVE